MCIVHKCVHSFYMFMYIYIYIVCVYVHIYTHIYVFVCIYVCAYLYVLTCLLSKKNRAVFTTSYYTLLLPALSIAFKMFVFDR